MAVPMNDNYLSRTKLFDKETLANATWAHLEMDVFAQHSRWNGAQVAELMGGRQPTFTIVRDPVQLFESLYSYMEMSETFKVDLKGFIAMIPAANLSAIRHLDLFGRNQMAWDLGMDPSQFDQGVKVIDRFIVRLEDQFDLVMLADRMEESLVLLRHLLCWPVDSMTHLNLNQRKPSAAVRLDAQEKQKLRKWLNVDSMIYDHFARLFETKVSQFGLVAMKEEVRMLDIANRKLMDRCVEERVGNEELSGPFRDFNDHVTGYVIKR